MRPAARNHREATVWTLVVITAVCFTVSLLFFSKLQRETTARRGKVFSEVSAFGNLVSSRMSGPASSTGAPPFLKTMVEKKAPTVGDVHLLQAVFYLGRHALWGLPRAPKYPVAAPYNGVEQVTGSDGRIVFTKRYDDGRMLVLAFGAPSYYRLKIQSGILVGLGVLFGFFLLAELLWLGLRSRRAGRDIEEALKKVGGFPNDRNDDDATQNLIMLFQQATGELKARQAELEEMHKKEKKRAQDVSGLAEALCTNLGAGYMRFDEEGRLAGINGAGRTLLGLQVIPVIGDPFDKLLSGRPETQAVLEEARRSRSLAIKDEVPGGRGIFLHVVALPLYNLLHHLCGHLLILKDQTGVYAMRKTLREREALSRLGEVSAGVAHEVRNALSTFAANLNLLVQDEPGLAGNRHFSALKSESTQLEQVVQNLLFFARPLPLTKEKCDLKPLLEAEASTLEAAFKGLSTEVDCPDGLKAYADYDALQRAIHNLGKNGAEATRVLHPEAGRVILSARMEEGRIAVQVEDDGPGFSPEMKDILFTPFSSEKPGGTGLGLAIARKIAREHGGDLILTTSALAGAGLLLTLPVVGG